MSDSAHGYTYDPKKDPVALDDRDPSNTDIEDLTRPLDPDDDVFTLLNVEPRESRAGKDEDNAR